MIFTWILVSTDESQPKYKQSRNLEARQTVFCSCVLHRSDWERNAKAKQTTLDGYGKQIVRMTGWQDRANRTKGEWGVQTDKDGRGQNDRFIWVLQQAGITAC